MTVLAIPLSGPIEAVVRPPGSKSITNRALVAAALASGTSVLSGALDSDDTHAMRTCLSQLGVKIETADGRWIVTGRDGRPGPTDEALDVVASGTTARFLTAVLTLGEGQYRLDGVPRMRERPISELAEALRRLGAEVETAGGYPPVTVTGTGLRAGEVEIDASRSSQFVSAMMLVAPYADGSVTLRFKGDVAVSRPYLATTAETMRAFGAAVTLTDTSVRVESGHRYVETDFTVEADASAAAYPLVAAAITGGRVVIEGVSESSTQADLGLLAALQRMGCHVERGGPWIRLTGPLDGKLTGITIDMNAMPDAVLALSVAAMFAEGPTVIENIATLRLKETDRLAALETELMKLGVDASAGPDRLAITPSSPVHGGVITTYDDHRMAMAFSLVGLRVPGVHIENPECVSKTWPEYFEMLDGLRAPL